MRILAHLIRPLTAALLVAAGFLGLGRDASASPAESVEDRMSRVREQVYDVAIEQDRAAGEAAPRAGAQWNSGPEYWNSGPETWNSGPEYA